MPRCQVADHCHIQRFGKTRVSDADRQPFRFQHSGRFFACVQVGAQRQERYVRALQDHPSLTDFQHVAAFGHLDPATVAPRIAEGNWSAVMRRRRRHHMHQLCLVGGSHDHHTRQRCQVTYVERARMGGPIGPHQTRAINGKAHRQPLKGHIMHNLIVPPLEERRIDRAERLQPAGRHPGGKGYSVLFRDPHVKDTRREPVHHFVDARAARHSRRDRDNRRVFGCQIDQCRPKHRRIARRIALALGLRAGLHIELGHTVIFVCRPFGGCVALALDRTSVDQDRASSPRTSGAQYGQHLTHIMTVNGADIVEPKLFEKRALALDAGHHLAGAARAVSDWFGQSLLHPFGKGLERGKGRVARKIRQIRAHRASGRCNRHLVVVEDHEQAAAFVARIVQRLIGHAGRNRAIANHSDRIARGHAHVAAHRESQSGRNGGRGMGRTEGIEIALRPLGEPAQAVLLAQCAHAVATARQYLMRIALVTHVPDQLVARRIKHRVNANSQFNHSQRRTKVPARAAHRLNHIAAQLMRNLG
mmetsp:Transcript_28312/g.52707  ORF Transcript_28312/g.52707 Transcript_28312/m.52707 type:complete len:531 (+) Transcript_28312:1773-3365(+)